MIPPRAAKRYTPHAGTSITINPVAIARDENTPKKRARIKAQKAAGKKPERMRKPGTKGAPTAKAFRKSAKTAKK